MLQFVLNLFSTAFGAVTGWFTQIYNASGVVSIWFGCILILLLVRYLVKPFLASGSDFVRKNRTKKDDE